jgi:hypothetical protein
VPADLEAVRTALAPLPAGARAEVAFGLGWGFAESAPAADLPAALQALGQPALRLDALHGAGACRHHFEAFASDASEGADDAALALASRDDALDAGLDAESRAALAAGRDWAGYPAAWMRAPGN